MSNFKIISPSEGSATSSWGTLVRPRYFAGCLWELTWAIDTHCCCASMVGPDSSSGGRSMAVGTTFFFFFEGFKPNPFKKKKWTAKEGHAMVTIFLSYEQPYEISRRVKVTIFHNDRRKFRSPTSDNMDRWKAEQGRGREKRKIRREKIRRESKKTEDTDARKGRKVAIHCVFPMICGSGGSKSRLAKAAGAEPAGHRSDEKLHAVVARSTFWNQKC